MDFAGAFPDTIDAKFAKEPFGNVFTHVPATAEDLHRAIGQDLFAVPGFAAWADKIADIMLG